MRSWRYVRRVLAAGIVILGTGLPLVGPASASPLRPAVTAAHSPVQTAELTASDGADGDLFGTSVAVAADGTTALIGAPDQDDYAGAVYVFVRTRTGWQQTAELTASDGVSGDAFGTSVAVAADGTTVVIGAPYRDSLAGAVYVFARTRTGWQQTAELTASDAASPDEFGTSVAVAADGTTALIGAPNHDLNTGAVYVFARTRAGWMQTGELTASDGAGGDHFGTSVAVAADGTTVVIGAPYRDSLAGAVYVFARTGAGWMQTAELTASDGAGGDHFGTSVAVAADGTSALIGAPNRDTSTGAVYVFARTGAGWMQTGELTASDGGGGDHFGTSVAVAADGTSALIGAPNRDINTGTVYVFASLPWW
jgi:hypothetical protein